VLDLATVVMAGVTTPPVFRQLWGGTTKAVDDDAR
jgi:hypothetical protein